MRKKKIFAVISAMIMSVSILCTTGISVKAEESSVTDSYSKIEWVLDNAVGTAQPLMDEDLQVVAEALGAETISNNGMDIFSQDTVFLVDWEHSQLQMEDVCSMFITYYWFTRDDSDHLVLEDVISTGGFTATYYEINDLQGASSGLWGNYWNFFDTKQLYSETTSGSDIGCYFKDWYGEGYGDRNPDMVTLGVKYNYDIESDTSWCTKLMLLPDNETTPFHFKEETEEDTSSTEETYTLDISDGNAVVSNETFAMLLEENKTKDVVIKSNNNVTFTFKAGTMKAVDGKDSYDFSITITPDFSTVTGVPSYVTQNNFISLINYNYSGELPAEASIRIPVGKDYAGQTLYYSQLLNNTDISLVSSVVVDSEGYITVTQSHCSSYLVTTEELKTEEDTTSPTETTKEPTETTTSPKTGDAAMILPFVLICVGTLGVMVALRKRVKA